MEGYWLWSISLKGSGQHFLAGSQAPNLLVAIRKKQSSLYDISSSWSYIYVSFGIIRYKKEHKSSAIWF